jgi:tellurite resistance protein TehA-like permease
MVLGLLTTSLLSIISFVISVYLGFTIQGPARVQQHVLFGLFATFLVTLAQSMTMFYFIGTGKQVKDLVISHSITEGFVQRTKVFKAKVFPPALWAMLFTMATMILGGGVHTNVIPKLVHTLLAAAALFFNVQAFVREVKYMVEHNVLMQELEKRLQSSPSVE